MIDKSEQKRLEHVWSVISHDLTGSLLAVQCNLNVLDEKIIPQLLEVYQKARDAGMDVPFIPKSQIETFTKTVPSAKYIVDSLRQVVSRWNRKILSDKFSIAKKPVAIAECVNTVITNYQAKYSLRDKSRIQIDLQEATVYGDEEMLEYMLYELFANAEYAFAASGADSNTVVFISAKSDANNYYLSIKNIGAPIAKNDLAKIFDPYFSTVKSHMGLGLTFCNHIMQSLGGNIVCNSDETAKTVEFVLKFSLVNK